MRTLFLILALTQYLGFGFCQNTFPVNGLRENTSRHYVFTGMTLVTAPGKLVQNAVLVIKNGVIIQAGTGISIPPDAEKIDLKGAWIYPSFIDAWSDYSQKTTEKLKNSEANSPQYDSRKEGPWDWNQAVKPEFKIADDFTGDSKAAGKLRESGFAFVNVVPPDGIFRGRSAGVFLNEDKPQFQIAFPELTACHSFEKGNSTQAYPSSQMGAIALIRQTFLDADWYKNARDLYLKNPALPSVETNLSLEALLLAVTQKTPFLFEIKEYQELLRAEKIAKEFGLNFIYKTSGDEFTRPDLFAANKPQIILSLKFPKAMEIKDPLDAREISLETLRNWSLAPGNPAFLEKNGVAFAFSLSGLSSPADLLPTIRKCITYGLSEKAALEALTSQPAAFLGISKSIGTLDAGKKACFIICSDNLFNKENIIYETWSDGNRFVNTPIPTTDFRGKYESTIEGRLIQLMLKGKINAPEGELKTGTDTTLLKMDSKISGDAISLSWKTKKDSTAAVWRFTGWMQNGQIKGYAESPTGARILVTFSRKGDATESKKDDKPEFTKPDWLPNATFPNMAFGNKVIPPTEIVFIKNATVWTNTNTGKVENTDVILQNGKVAAVGKSLSKPASALEIDGTGKHLSPGIIDEHSHIAISKGVNEGSHAVTAEVSISDVINSDDINIYRQLAGGVTTSQLLHGSANPIGGQSAIIKLRWGMTAEEMKFAEAPPFIKFALGENVKQSNWGDQNTIRYPQTRMGVEQVIQDAFQAALDYRAAINRGEVTRRNIQLETLLQIIDKKRFITCHSYVQSEITMLMRVAESFGFRINTFTHILEGYKVADKMKAHGVYASTFADWWAYKYEVVDAIPHNASLLTKAGVITCVNSDDAEMGRRLNQEAAKGIKYGGMTEEEALKMVTLNPAKALHVDHRVGSIKVGMDADVVLWSGNPLSVYSYPEKTWIDGRRFFDLEKDAALREEIKSEKAKLIQMMLHSPESGKAPPSAEKEKKLYECETIESDYNE